MPSVVGLQIDVVMPVAPLTSPKNPAAKIEPTDGDVSGLGENISQSAIRACEIMLFKLGHGNLLVLCGQLALLPLYRERLDDRAQAVYTPPSGAIIH